MSEFPDFEAGQAAARAREPIPEGASEQFRQGWAHADTERRIDAGEVLGFVCGATRCAKCGGTNWGYRAGCSCWPTDTDHNPFTEEGCKRIADDGYRIDWGVLLCRPNDRTKSEFMTREELVTAIQAGKPLVDCFSGEPVPA